jgi:hypothetical protein
MKLSPILLIALSAALTGALTAGVARAQTAEPAATPQLNLHMPEFSQAPAASAPVARPVGVAPKATPDLADPLDPMARPKLVVNTLDSEVFATTAVDHKFGKRDDVTAALGLLCGRQPEHTESGGAAAYGTDPHGRFVGAKLSFAF